MTKISVCLATFNEEKNLKNCLESVRQLAEEIVVVDGTSTDKTVAIARKYTSKIIVRENPPMFHLNKQKAFEAATGDWILYLDADEHIDEPLRKEILAAVKKKEYAGFWIPRKNIIFGKWIQHSLWYPDYQLRLFRRGKAYLPCKSVHEQPVLSGKAGRLKHPLIHDNYQTISQYVQKLNELYTENDARVFLAEKKKLYWYDAFRFPFQDFLSTFFARQGYKDGFHGLVLSILQAFSTFVTFAKVWEVQGFKEMKERNLLQGVEKELVKVGKEWRYWLLTSLIEEESSFLKKAVFRIKRRLRSRL